MYWLPTSCTARVVSQTTNATQAMKMNMIFCSSPMPKSEKVKGISAATGMLRPNRVIGRKNACTLGKQPHSTPSGTPTSAARPNPERRRRSVVRQVARQGPVEPQGCESLRRFRPGSTAPSKAR